MGFSTFQEYRTVHLLEGLALSQQRCSAGDWIGLESPGAFGDCQIEDVYSYVYIYIFRVMYNIV